MHLCLLSPQTLFFFVRVFPKTVETELLTRALLDEGPDGLAQRILSKAGVDASRFSADLDGFM